MNVVVKERTDVLNLINEWNTTRLDLFKISEPNEVLDFYGVMRFYYQDTNNKVTTKCIRVANTATTIDIIRVLIEKLRPDMKTLPDEKDFSIYEVYPNGEERKLQLNENPLWIQLYWGKDQREGRFVLQNIKFIDRHFNERQSSKHKKKNGIDENDTPSSVLIPTTIGESLYKSLPETNKFTRSLSNPEMVKKIQQDRLKQKFIKISTKEGGGTMKVFGDALNPSVPYKTFLLSVSDTAEWVVKEMLEKYGLKHEDPVNYCLLQIVIPPHDKPIKEVILHDKECPLSICLNHAQKNEGSIMFKIIKCPLEYVELRKRLHAQELALKILQTPSIQDRTINDHLPMFIEVNNDGTDLSTPRIFKLHPNITYVGRDAKAGIGKQYLFIDGHGIDRDHCKIQNQNGIVTLIPRGEIRLNGTVISTPFVLQHAAIICFGRNSTFRYCEPQLVQKTKSFSKQNRDKSSLYSSAPILSTKTNNSESGTSHIQQKKISPTNILASGPKINVLPGLLDVPAETEIRFLHAVFDNYPLNNIHFRLSPVYTLYMTLRYRLSPYGKSNISSFVQKQEDVLSLLYRIEDMISKKIEMGKSREGKTSNMTRECQEHAGYLAYWLANTSELLYFLKQDQVLSKMSYNTQVRLTSFIQRSFYYLINLLQNELDKYLIVFTNPRDDVEQDIHLVLNNDKVSDKNHLMNHKSSDIRWIVFDKNSNKYHQSTIGDILAILSSIMDLLRKCRVNPALTIQIFSQIFFYINTCLFNRIVCCPELKLCSAIWGEKLLFRIKSISNWAQLQGLELPSECHLMKVNQLCLLLKSSKQDMYDIQQLISNNIFKINSLQIKQILNNYILGRNEPPISNNFSQALVSAACKHVDENLHREGFIIQLAEDTESNLPFLLPEDGYTFENLQGIPQQLFEFIEPISRSGLCRLFINPHSLGRWTEFMQITNIENSPKNNDRTETIVLHKKGNSLGLSIVAAKSDLQQVQGIYVRGIVPNGAAEDDGHLQPGDQILSVDKVSLLDMTQEQAAEALKQCGSSVTLQILKHAANHHGLSTLFTTPSEIHHELTHVPSSISHQSPPSTLAVQTSNSHERLSTIHQSQNLPHQFSPSIIHPCVQNISNHQHLLIEPSRSIKILNNYTSQQHQSAPNLTYTKQFDNHENSFQPINFVRSTNQTQSFMNRSISKTRPLVFREDVAPDQYEHYHEKSAIAPKTLPKPIIGTTQFIRQTNSNNDGNITNRLSSSLRKSQSEQHEPIKLANAYQNNISEIRLKRINNLIAKINRTEQEEKELNNLKLEDEFDRRVEEFYYQTNGNNNQETSSPSLNKTDEMNEFDEKLKRRLEQFEQEREIERANINRMLAKREADIEACLRKDREREIRSDFDIQEFQTRRMSEEDRLLEAKKEQARLSKHVRLPKSLEKDNGHVTTEEYTISFRNKFNFFS